MDAESSEEYHVLAVDDSIIDRKLIERLLKTSSYQVTTVDSGSKALEFLGLREEEDEDQSSSSSSSSDSPSVSPNNHHHQEVEVNMIITDYCMPGMTGYDLLKKIKESTYLRDIPVVIMSSENVPARITRCLEEGAEEFLLKPVRLADVKKLKPHMMKTKQLKQQQQQQEQQQQPDIKKEEQEEESELRMAETVLLQPQPKSSSSSSSNSSSSNSSSKRKAKEEGLSPDRRRRR